MVGGINFIRLCDVLKTIFPSAYDFGEYYFYYSFTVHHSDE